MPYKAPWADAGRTTPLPTTLRAVPPATDRDDFVAVSSELTGFDEIELLGTGAVDVYMPWLFHAFPDVTPALLAAWRDIRDDPDVESAVRRRILGDQKLGPFARAIIVLWYTATWNALGKDWTDRYGNHPENVNHVFGAVYPEGLVWKVADLHPSGAKPTGFGTWSFPPRG